MRPHVWQKRGIGKELHLVSSADAVAYAKAIVVKFERRCWTNGRSFLLRRPPQQTFTIRATGTGVRQSFAPTPRNSRSRSRALITHRTSQKAELFCEIRMMRPGCGCHRKTCDGRLLLRAFPEIADTTGGRIAQKTNFSIAILLTESLHHFA
ncbi:hypothetical protein [Bradyrhizobium sp. McL0615]|uniref:hypothetical protein n=1 Tax=Bradyrhizobium sp. McL0615 TaxID=3415673 RepID=UPI003CF343C0